MFLVFFAAVTWQRVRAWHETETLFTDTLRKDPANIFAARTLGRYYSVTVSTPEKAVPFLHKSMGLTEKRIGRLTNPSLVHFEQYNLAELRNALGIVSRESGQYEKAVALHQSAIAEIANTELDSIEPPTTISRWASRTTRWRTCARRPAMRRDSLRRWRRPSHVTSRVSSAYPSYPIPTRTRASRCIALVVCLKPKAS